MNDKTKARHAIEDWTLGTLQQWFDDYTDASPDPLRPELGNTQFKVRQRKTT